MGFNWLPTFVHSCGKTPLKVSEFLSKLVKEILTSTYMRVINLEDKYAGPSCRKHL